MSEGPLPMEPKTIYPQPRKPSKRKRAPQPIKRGTKPRRTRKTTRATLIRQADALCGELVRGRGACEACGKTTDLQWAHAYSRKYLKTRWTWTYCLCRGCHYKYTLRWEAWLEWLLDREGPGVLRELQLKALDVTPISNDDIQATIDDLRRQLAGGSAA